MTREQRLTDCLKEIYHHTNVNLIYSGKGLRERIAALLAEPSTEPVWTDMDMAEAFKAGKERETYPEEWLQFYKQSTK